MQLASPPDKANPSILNAISPGSVLPSTQEAQQILARATAETRIKRQQLPSPDAGKLVPAADVAPTVATIPKPTATPVPMDEEERKLRERAVKCWEAAGVPPRYADADLLAIDQGVGASHGESGVTYGEAVYCLTATLTSPGTVALLGERGAGKTWMACGLVREFCRRGRGALYRDAMDYFLELKSTYDRDAKRSQEQVEAAYLKPSLLVLDELHERGDTVWEDRMLTRLINKRYAAKLATVLIANQSPKEFKDRVGHSIHDRMFDGGGIVVCDWKSLRGRKS